jgi:hypothetical protein
VILDSAGNLYGTTAGSGDGDTVFELSPPATPGAPWTETTLYTLAPVSYPHGLIFDGHGNLYGKTEFGGKYGGGNVYELSPPAIPGASWVETDLNEFTGGRDGGEPEAGLVFDGSGNLYGTASEGGIIEDCSDMEQNIGCGVVFELSPKSNGTWTETALYAFTGKADSFGPDSGLIFDNAGALYGTALLRVFQLAPPLKQGEPWTEATIHSFPDNESGSNPVGGLVFDKSWNLYGATYSYGSSGYGSIYQLSPPAQKDGAWVLSTLYRKAVGFNSPFFNGSLIFGKWGALYGNVQETTDNSNNYGSVFRIAP